jgi:glycosyltransferase involved in cell wall biosynthesis
MNEFNTCDVSVIIPTYNSENFIRYTLDSIINQKLKPSEIIVVDDCSSDDTYNIILKYAELYKNLIKVYRNASNMGISYSRNFGTRCSSKNYIIFMDHDDIAETDLIFKEYNQLINLKEKSVGKFILVYSSYIQIDEKGQIISDIIKGKQVEPDEVLGYEFVRNFIITVSGVLLKKDLFLSIGGFDEKLKYSQDWDLWLKLAQKGGFIYIDKPLINVRRYLGNTSSSITNFLKDEIKILMQYDLSFIKKSVYKRKLSWQINKIDYVSILIRLSKLDEAIEILNDIQKKDPSFASSYFFKGIILIKKNELHKAIGEFEQTILINSSHGAALNNLAALLILIGENERASKILKQALNLYSNYLDAIHNMRLLFSNNKIKIEDVKITWRELREVLLSYSSN